MIHPWLKFRALPVAIVAWLAVSTAAAEPSSSKPVAVSTAFALRDAAGQKHSAAEWHAKKAIVLFFIATECPVSNFYSPDFAHIAHEYAEKGVLVYGVHSDPDVTASAAAAHAKEYGLKFPVLLDPNQKLAAAVGAEKTPEAFVLAPDGEVLYHGRIDDRYAVNGKRRDEPTRHELEDAIRAALASKTPEVKATQPYGCPIPKR